MLPKFSVFLILAVVFLSLTGCDAAPLPAQRLSGVYSDVSDVAIAIDPAGGKHTLTVECPQRGILVCNLSYRTFSGYETPFVLKRDAPAGTIQRYPDIVVDSEDGVYLVWQECATSTMRCVDYWANTSDSGFPNASQLDADITRPSAGPPKVEARGTHVYAVYNVRDGSGSALRYRQLSPLDASGGWVSDHPANSGLRQYPSLAITNGGILYVSWLSFWLGESTVMLNDNYGVTGDMPRQMTTVTGDFSAPAAGMDADDEHFFSVWVENREAPADPLSDLLWVLHCEVAFHDCTTSGGFGMVDLPATEHWQMWGSPAAAADASNAYIAFSAKNDDTGSSYEIFRLQWGLLGGNYGTPVQVSSNGLKNGQPFVGLVDGFDVIVWRTVGTLPNHHGDIYMRHLDAPQGEVIRKADNWNGRDGADVASNGNHMAGIWNEYNAGQEQTEAWVMFSGSATYLPLIVR